ncbi:IS110 family transposase, partial [Lactobacillus helveticus]|uniref:IS110 family transposase n=1 Tax=Lactobacillus helveticus TaxID=1587 RepID=UPI001C268C7A
MTYNVVFGIDVSSKSSTVSVLIKRNEFKHFTIANDLVGFNELLEQLQCYKHPVVIFEATGVYSLPLQSFLDHQNYDYTRINRLSAKKLMDNNLRHLKTDRTDAHNLAKIQFDVPQPLTPKQDYRYHEM